MPISTELADIKEGLAKYDDAIEDGEEHLVKMGFPPAQRPQNAKGRLQTRPTLPDNMSELSMSELQNLLGYFTAWHSYACELLPRAAKDRDAAFSAREFVRAKIRKSKAGTVKDKDDHTLTDARYVDANARFETCDYIYIKLRAIKEGLQREIETISRVQTAMMDRKQSEGSYVAGERRAHRVGQAATDVMQRFRVKKNVEED